MTEPRSAQSKLVAALRDAIAAVNGPVRYTPSATYTPQISVLRVEEWKKALNAVASDQFHRSSDDAEK